jgi:uncharacterized damage-inducible protein DinB
MKELFVINAQYNREANRTFLSILNGLSNAEREQDRGSYYKSLSGLITHILGGNTYLLGMFQDAVAHNDAALKALAALKTVTVPQEGPLSDAQWKQLAADFETVDTAYIDFTKALTDADLKVPVKIDWYGGNPGSVPAFFLLNQLTAHGTHHRGQVSQILDALKIANDYSGVSAAFLKS